MGAAILSYKLNVKLCSVNVHGSKVHALNPTNVKIWMSTIVLSGILSGVMNANGLMERAKESHVVITIQKMPVRRITAVGSMEIA